MSFIDFYIRYKILSKEKTSNNSKSNNTHKNNKRVNLPIERFIILFFLIISAIICLICVFLGCTLVYSISLGIEILICLFIYWYTNTPSAMKYDLENIYKPNSKKRMDKCITLLAEYNIKPNDYEKIDLLIAEAIESQKDYNTFYYLSKLFKPFLAILISIFAFGANVLKDNVSAAYMLKLTIIALIIVMLFFSILFLFGPPIKSLFYQDYNYHAELIKDLRALKIFNNNEFENSSETKEPLSDCTDNTVSTSTSITSKEETNIKTVTKTSNPKNTSKKKNSNKNSKARR